MTLAAALLLEWLFADPPNRWHPVAWFGRWAGWCEGRLYADSRRAGVFCWAFVLVPALALVLLAHQAGWIADALLLWVSLGWRSLFAHVRQVLEAESVDAARRAVSRIVSRDTASMSGGDARKAALESLAENASDAVVAPLVWFVLLGAPGAAFHRMVNTLDAMWGYRNARYRFFGWWAARVDDVMNWLPARLTAILFAIVGRTPDWRALVRQAGSHASPNAGWPEAALAFAADVRLGGPVMRGGCIDKRPEYGPGEARDSEQVAAEAVRLVRRMLVLAAWLAMGVTIVC